MVSQKFVTIWNSSDEIVFILPFCYLTSPIRYLRRLLAVPPEGEDVLARLHLGHLHLVHDGEEELGGTWSYVALSVPREAGGWRRELRWMGEKWGRRGQRSHLSAACRTARRCLHPASVRVEAGRDGVLGPLTALRPGALRGPVGQEGDLLPALPVLDPLAVPVEGERRGLETLLGHHSLLGSLAQPVAVTT